MELTLAYILASQERQKERVREELIIRAERLEGELNRLRRKLMETNDPHINSLGECQMESVSIDRLCGIYMEKRDLIHELKGESFI